MRFRSLCMALVVLIVAAPLAASWCSSCAGGFCVTPGIDPAAKHQLSEKSEAPEIARAQAKSVQPGPCHGGEAAVGTASVESPGSVADTTELPAAGDCHGDAESCLGDAGTVSIGCCESAQSPSKLAAAGSASSMPSPEAVLSLSTAEGLSGLSLARTPPPAHRKPPPASNPFSKLCVLLI